MNLRLLAESATTDSDNYAEILAAQNLYEEYVSDVDSWWDIENYDTVVDDVTDNSNGDEDDHDRE